MVQQAEGERNFHIFVYLFDGLDGDARRHLRLSAPADFRYLRSRANSDGSSAADNAAKFQHIIVCWREKRTVEEEEEEEDDDDDDEDEEKKRGRERRKRRKREGESTQG